MKQTAVEWLLEMQLKPLSEWPENIYEQAIELEKQQIINTYISCLKENMINPLDDIFYKDDAEQYYNKTYKSEQ